MKITVFLKILILVMITSCATGENFSSVREGMTKTEVYRALGNHDQLKRSEGGWATYFYRDRLMSGWSWDKTDYYVVFDPDGKVFEYGHGAVDTRTSERMAQWRHQQQLINAANAPVDVDCSSYKIGDSISTHCRSR